MRSGPRPLREISSRIRSSVQLMIALLSLLATSAPQGQIALSRSSSAAFQEPLDLIAGQPPRLSLEPDPQLRGPIRNRSVL